MKVIRKTSDYDEIRKPLSAALGNFDGVHLGHRTLIRRLTEECVELGRFSAVITFEPHPLTVLNNGSGFRLLSPTEQKLELLEALGVDYTILLPFDKSLAATSPADFARNFLTNTLEIKKVFVGFNYTFGAGGQGNTAVLRELGEKYGFAVDIMPPAVIDGEVVSSTLIRDLYSRGDVDRAAKFLGYNPIISGMVGDGVKRGRTLGFPTANITVSRDLLLPAYGVYACWTEINKRRYPSLVNIGVKPTFGLSGPTVEVHIIDFAGDLYRQEIKIGLLRRIRQEQRFPSPEELRLQIEKDVAYARKILKEDL